MDGDAVFCVHSVNEEAVAMRFMCTIAKSDDLRRVRLRKLRTLNG